MADNGWRVARFMGETIATLRELNKNQDELNDALKTLWGMHSNCREEVLKALTILQTDAKHVGKIRGIIIGVLATITGGTILALVLKALGI